MNIEGLRYALDHLYKSFSSEYLPGDPVIIPHEFSAQKDIEVAAFIAALFSYGKVSLFLPRIRQIISSLEKSPYDFLYKSSEDMIDQVSELDGFYYRFQKEDDLRLLLKTTSLVLKEYGSLENLFMKGYTASDQNVASAMNLFLKEYHNIAYRVNKQRVLPGSFKHLLPEPGPGAMKRVNMFLRWMVRKDQVDFGIWKKIGTSQLLIPLDVHIKRLAGYLGLSHRKSSDLKTSIEITESLKLLDPHDPVKYDFALTRLGMNLCISGKGTYCKKCPLAQLCSEFRS